MPPSGGALGFLQVFTSANPVIIAEAATTHRLGDTVLKTNALLRNEPVQARSTARLTALLDAAASSIDTHGYERLTTAMVAEKAGASIGTVYRYFPDRIAVLKAVGLRAIDRFTDNAKSALSRTSSEDWKAGFDALLDEFEKAYRNEAAFAAVRFGDVLDLRPREDNQTGLAAVIESFADTFSAKFSVPRNGLVEKLEIAFTIADALYARAFRFNAKGDTAIVAQAREAAHHSIGAALQR